jgi:hypothetical protein
VQIRFVDWVQGWNNLSKGDGTLQTSKKKKKKKKNPQKRNTGKRKLRIFWIYIGRVAICDAIHMCHV